MGTHSGTSLSFRTLAMVVCRLVLHDWILWSVFVPRFGDERPVARSWVSLGAAIVRALTTAPGTGLHKHQMPEQANKLQAPWCSKQAAANCPERHTDGILRPGKQG